MKQMLEVDIPTPVLNLTLSPETPLICDVGKAVELFGIGKTTFEALRNTYPDFPVRLVGRSVRYLVPDIYAWFRDFPNREISID